MSEVIFPRKLSRKDINVHEWEFEFQQRNAHPILMADFWCQALYRYLVPEIRLPIQPYDYLFAGSSKGYVKTKRKRALMEALAHAIRKNSYRAYLYRTAERRVVTFEKVTGEILERLAPGPSRHELLELWRIFQEHFLRLIPWYYIPYYVTEPNFLSDAVKKGLTRHRAKVENITDMQNALMALIFPNKPLGFQAEQEAFYRLPKHAGRKKT